MRPLGRKITALLQVQGSVACIVPKINRPAMSASGFLEGAVYGKAKVRFQSVGWSPIDSQWADAIMRAGHLRRFENWSLSAKSYQEISNGLWSFRLWYTTAKWVDPNTV
jgi:hypothetical protein